MGLYRLFNVSTNRFESIDFYTVPIVVFVILFVVNWHLCNVYSYLVPKINHPDQIDLRVDIDIIDPFELEQNVPIPPYLEEPDGDNPVPVGRDEENNEDLEDSINELNINDNDPLDSVMNQHHERKRERKGMFKWGKIFWGLKHSRHERLFYLGKIGVFLSKNLIMATYVVLVLFLATMAQTNGYDHFEMFDNTGLNIAAMCISIVMAILILLFYLPSVIFQYVLNTSIQMMKRRDYIESVIKEQKYQKSLRSMRMYRVFKVIRRELIEANDKDPEDLNLKQFSASLLNENIGIFARDLHDPDEEIPISTLSDFYPLNGKNLLKLETYILMHKAKSGGNTVTPNGLRKAIREITNDVKADPYDVVLYVFLLYKNKGKELTVEEIKKFFTEFEGYFELKDVEDFMDEILSIQRRGGLIDLQEIASMIRDDIECFPR